MKQITTGSLRDQHEIQSWPATFGTFWNTVYHIAVCEDLDLAILPKLSALSLDFLHETPLFCRLAKLTFKT